MSAGRGFWATAVIVAVIVVIAAAIGIAGCGKSSDAKIITFTVEVKGEAKSAQVLSAEGRVNLTIPYGTDLTRLYPNISISPKAIITPPSGAEVNFSKGPMPYTVKAENGKEKVWNVIVTVAPNTEAEIISFNLWLNVSSKSIGQVEINSGSASVKVKVSYGTDLTKLILGGEVSPGATSDFITTAESRDFSKPVVCKVTAQDKTTTKDWTITVTVAEPTKTIELTKVVLGGQEAVIDTTNHMVWVRVSAEVQLNAVVVTELAGAFGKVKPALAVGDTLDFSKGVKTFTFAVQDTRVKATEKWKFFAYHPAVADSVKPVIGKGEGVEHALIRQLLTNPIAWGYAGSLTNRAATRKWAGGEAHRIAIRAGYVDYKTGKEIRVAKVGTVYLLADDQGVVVYEYANVKDYEATNVSAADENVAAKTCKEGKFAGADKETEKLHVQGYEYIFTPCLQEISPQAKAPVKDVGEVDKDAGSRNVVPEIGPITPSGPVSFDELPAIPVFPNLIE